jgi:hypothetical protein
VPTKITTVVGGHAEFRIVTNVTGKWLDVTRISNSTTVFPFPVIIFLDGRMTEGFGSHYTVTRDSNGVYTFSIRNVTFADEGVYAFQDDNGVGDVATASLTVLNNPLIPLSTADSTQNDLAHRVTTTELLKQDDSHQCHVAGKVTGAFFGGLFTGLFILIGIFGGLWIYCRTHKSDKRRFSNVLQPFVHNRLATDNRIIENVPEAVQVDRG